MGTSARLRGTDYRAIFHLIGECRDLGADPVAWRLHLLTRLTALLGAKVGAGGEAIGIDQGRFVPLSTVDVGWSSNDEQRAMFEWMQHQAESGATVGLLPEMPKVKNGGVLVARDDAVSDDEWRRSVQFNDYLRRSAVDDLLVSFQRIAKSSGRFCGLTLFRALGERKFSGRDKAFLATVHQDVATMIGRQLAAAHEPSATELSPRLRQVLACLLEGDSEKQVADRLSLSRQTVNQYVKAIYRHFLVNSRAELMARWIRFGTHDQVPSSQKSPIP